MFNAQFIKTEGDDVVVLSRRDYDALLARAGDSAAEDAATARILAETNGQTALPAGVMDRIIDGQNPIAVLMAHRGLTQAQLSAKTGLSQPFVSKLARHKRGVGASRTSIRMLAHALNVSMDVLESLEAK